MSSDSKFLIVGGGLAGAKAAEALREAGYDGQLALVGDEEQLPYERPPLSKDYLAGSASLTDLRVHDEQWYADNSVDLMLGKAATGVDAAAKAVELVDGSRLQYDKLMLATGSSARQLPLPGASAHGVLTLRRIEDSDRIKEVLERQGSLAVIGGGWIGMEVAANARSKGCDVTVLEAADLPLSAVLGPELARVFLDLHREHGVEFQLGAKVAEITASDSVATGVRLQDGTWVEAGAVLVGVGATPNLDLAKSASLDIDNGVLVDEALQSSNPDIVVAGDIANHQHPVLGSRIRVEHWANALNQPTAAAATMLGKHSPYTELPYFFTDQFDLGMEYIGHAAPGSYAKVVTRGPLETREFIAFWLDDSDRVLAGMNVNVWDVVDDIKALILSKASVDVDKLADPNTPLSDLHRG